MTSLPISLVLCDVDGTLVTPDKELTSASVAAVRSLRDAGIQFALTSGRPPRGLRMLIDPLEIDTPLSAFNGGEVVDRTMATLEEHVVDAVLVPSLLDRLARQQLSVWIYQGVEWYVLDRDGPHVQREAKAIAFQPTVLNSFDDFEGPAAKIVGVSDDPALMAVALTATSEEFATRLTVSSSQTYYLDVTHKDANKGWVVHYLASALGLDPASIVTIGDAENDVAMFQESGVSIAMGNASDTVKSEATHVSLSNKEDGFAHAVTTFVLPTK